MFHLIQMCWECSSDQKMCAANTRGQSTRQSTCWACSSARTSLDGNLNHALDTDEMLQHMMLFNKCTYKYWCWTSRVSDSYGRLKALMLGVLTVSISGFLGWVLLTYFPAISIRVWRIYSNIRIFEYIGHEYIFGHSFVSIFLLRIYSDIRSCQICLYEYIRTFVGECVRV